MIPEKKAFIPQRFWEVTLDDYKDDGANTKAKDAVRAYINDLEEHRAKGTGITLSGPPGTGKTMLACTIGRGALEMGYSVAYVPMALYIRWGLNLISWGNKEEMEDDWVKLQRKLLVIRNKVEFLILDDVGKEHHTHTRFAEDEFDFLVRLRYDKALPTIITTNVPVADWSKTYSGPMESFAYEAFPEVEVLAKDRRKM